MNEVNNNKQRNMFVIGLVALLLLVVGATYAYFAVTTVNNFGTSTINATAGEIGLVTLNGSGANLNMNLTALDMAQGSSDVTYYASPSGKTTTPTTVTIGTASVTPNTDVNYYHCTYTLSVTHTGTNDMYDLYNHKTGNVYDYSNTSTGQIILTINDTNYDFYSGWPTNNQINGVFNIQGSQTVDITASLRFINKRNVDQSYLADSDISITISLVNNSFSCTAVEEPWMSYYWNENNPSNIEYEVYGVVEHAGYSTYLKNNSGAPIYGFADAEGVQGSTNLSYMSIYTCFTDMCVGPSTTVSEFEDYCDEHSGTWDSTINSCEIFDSWYGTGGCMLDESYSAVCWVVEQMYEPSCTVEWYGNTITRASCG